MTRQPSPLAVAAVLASVLDLDSAATPADWLAGAYEAGEIGEDEFEAAALDLDAAGYEFDGR